MPDSGLAYNLWQVQFTCAREQMVQPTTTVVPGAILLCLLLPMLVRADTQDVDLPELGSAADQALTPQMERILGRMVLRRVSPRAIDDLQVNQYLQQLGKRLAEGSQRTAEDFAFVPVDDKRINAFAAPGGVVGINTGIFLNSSSVHETAAVVAHEIAHVTQKHLARAYSQQSTLTLQNAVTLVGAILLATVDPQLAQAAVTIGTASSLQRQINFTRANEQEADRVGMQVLTRAGYNPSGMPDFFGKLLRASRHVQSELPEFLRTHPLTENRLAEARSLATLYPARNYPADTDFLLIRTRLQLRNMSHTEALRHFEQKLMHLKADTPPEEVAAIRYGYALALINLRHYDQARTQLQQLLDTDSMRLSYLLAQARLELDTEQPDQADNWFQKARQLYPDHSAPVLEQARGWLRFQRPRQASALLREYGRFRKPLDISYYELSARAEAEAGFPGSSALALSQASYLKGQTQQAVKQLQTALKSTTAISEYDRQRIRVRLAELELQQQIEKKLKL